ncbi:MAG TPA: PTS system mannose/fructose/sorbose family transporter subunit IID [Gemmatimonadales bacterium]|nr:PTS system mannose/fructose/sorbose family transporter subunit IID [Gemmatimonadales bacterium]
MTGAAQDHRAGLPAARGDGPPPERWSGSGRALLRLLAVQGAWSYERMQGVGAGWAAAPLLRPLAQQDAERYRAAVARSAEFFNANPNLAGLAVGAEVRAEFDGLPPEQIRRLRTALCSPLGALGDQVFWAGLVPALVALAVAGVALGGGAWPVAALVAVYALVRLWTARWALRTGLASGMSVGRVVTASWLPRAVPRVGPLAAFALGLAAPLAAAWLLPVVAPGHVAGVLVVAALGVGLGQWLGTRVTAVRFGLGALGIALLLRWVTA